MRARITQIWPDSFWILNGDMVCSVLPKCLKIQSLSLSLIILSKSSYGPRVNKRTCESSFICHLWVHLIIVGPLNLVPNLDMLAFSNVTA